MKNTKRFTKSQVKNCFDSRSFYRALNMMDLFKIGEIETIAQMRISTNTFAYIENVIYSNYKKYIKVHSEVMKYCSKDNIRKMANNLQRDDMLNFLPKVDESLEDWIIVWDSMEDKDGTDSKM